MRPASRAGFSITIICALPLEADPVRALFDETYDTFSKFYGKEDGDNNQYVNGRIGNHHVVLCYLPGMGKGTSAAAAANLRVSYKNIQLALVVGICGGVPWSKNQIILGDVIISNSIVEYDFGSQYPNGFRRKGNVTETLGRPNQNIRSFLAALSARAEREGLQKRTYRLLQTLSSEKGWNYPRNEHDTVFESSYQHKHHDMYQSGSCTCTNGVSGDDVCEVALNASCSALGCTPSAINRERLAGKTPTPHIHIGKMASADTVMKSGEHRDQIVKIEDVIGFEMEGAGVWDNIPCIIIKGVCDYADSHKNKIWQDYAAASAACCTKAFLENWKPHTADARMEFSLASEMYDHFRDYYTGGRRLRIQRISGELLPMDHCYINLAMVELMKTCANRPRAQKQLFAPSPLSRVKHTGERLQVSLQNLFEPRSQSNGMSILPRRVLIKGPAGVGKTTLCKKIIHEWLYRNMWGKHFDLIIWIPLRRLKATKHKRFTIESILYDLYFSEVTEDKNSAAALKQMLYDPGRKHKILLVLDGLDEVSQEWETETPMHNFFLHLLDHSDVIVTSRPQSVNAVSLGSFDLELEAIGFNTPQIQAYVKEVNRHDSVKANNILSFIMQHEPVQKLVQIPIQLDALCYCWDDGFLSGEQLRTMTSLYKRVNTRLWQKDILRLGYCKMGIDRNESAIRSLTAHQVEEIVLVEANYLEILAFTGMYNGMIEFTPNQRHHIYDSVKKQGVELPNFPETALRKTSFLHTSDRTILEQDQTYHFIHLTVQEFFAARYLARCWLENENIACIRLRQETANMALMAPQTFVKKEKDISRYDLTLRFTAGLIQTALAGPEIWCKPLEDFFFTLNWGRQDLLSLYHKRVVIHCYDEIAQGIKGNWSLDGWGLFEEHLTEWLTWKPPSTWGSFTHPPLISELAEHQLASWILADLPGLMEASLDVLSQRSQLSFCVLDYAITLMESDCLSLARQAAEVMSKQTALPEEILEKLYPLLNADDEILRYKTLSALIHQFPMPHAVIKYLSPYLNDEDNQIRCEVLHAFTLQNPLPTVVYEAFLTLLNDLDKTPSMKLCEIIVNLSSRQSLEAEFLESLFPFLKSESWPKNESAALILIRDLRFLPSVLEAQPQILHVGDSYDMERLIADAIQDYPPLTPEELEAMALPSENDSNFVSQLKFEILKRQKTLPASIAHALLAMLNDDRLSGGSAAAGILRQQQILSTDVLDTLQSWPFTPKQCIDCWENERKLVPLKMLFNISQLLKSPDEETRSRALNTLLGQPFLPPDVLDTALGLLQLEDPCARDVAVTILSHQSCLPERVLKSLEELLHNEQEGLNTAVVSILIRGQSYIPLQVMETIYSVFEKAPYPNSRIDIAHLLNRQSFVPEAILMKLLPMLVSQNAEERLNLARVLANHPNVVSRLPVKYWKSLYEEWFKLSFTEQLSCSLENNQLYIGSTGRELSIKLEPKQLRIFKVEIRNAQKALSLPSVLTTTLFDEATSWAASIF